MSSASFLSPSVAPKEPPSTSLSLSQPSVPSLSQQPSAIDASAPALPTQPHPTTHGIDGSRTVSPFSIPQLSASTEAILRRVSANSLALSGETGNETRGMGYELAREHVLKSMATSDKISAPTPPGRDIPAKTGRGRGRPGRGGRDVVKAETPSTPVSMTALPAGSGSGRGRGRGRPSGKLRGGRGGARGGKRKREGSDNDDEDVDSDVSEEITALPTTTKSGRSVTKPDTFAPPMPQPPGFPRRKRMYNKRTLESALCKVCLRGHSPASNMIVFCSECNTPYHRYCHFPPIDQQVVDVPEMDWYCEHCKSHKETTTPAIDLDSLVSGEGMSEDEKRTCLSNLPPSTLVSLLLKVNSTNPDLPIFPPSTRSTVISNLSAHPAMPTPPITHPAAPEIVSNGHVLPIQQAATISPAHLPAQPESTTSSSEIEDSYPDYYAPGDPPANFPRPGFGLAKTLPPETEDLQWLTDDNYDVYSHIYQTDHETANRAVLGVREEKAASPEDARTGGHGSTGFSGPNGHNDTEPGAAMDIDR
ncbi:hypothetical protein LTR66_003814 [Elasticomyces elasticus]|nr:hypothetical protein LTR66_003814 [Elasticomyces elasticus]